MDTDAVVYPYLTRSWASIRTLRPIIVSRDMCTVAVVFDCPCGMRGWLSDPCSWEVLQLDVWV